MANSLPKIQLLHHSYSWSRAGRPFPGTPAPSSNRTCGFPAYGFPCETVIADTSCDSASEAPTFELWFFLCLSRQSFLSEGELHEARQASPCGDMRGFFFRIGLFRQSDLPLSIPDVSFYTRNPFAPRALPRFPATMDPSDSSFRFRSSEVSQVPGRTVATRPPTVSRLLSPSHADWTVCEGFTLGDGWPAEMYRNETLPPIHLC